MTAERDDSFGLALHDLRCAIAGLDRVIEADANESELADLAWLLKDLDNTRGDFTDRGLYQQLAQVISMLKATIAKRLPYGEDVTVEGVGVLRYASSGGKTTWDWPGLVPVLAAQIADEVFDRETGEVPPLAVVCERAIDAFGDIVGLTPSKSGRKTALKSRGIDPKKFVTTTDAEPSVRFL